MVQVGAIYLWSYVYNLVRVSSVPSVKETEINDSSVQKSPRETSTSDKAQVTEPLLSSKEFLASGDHQDQYTLPCTRYDGRTEVSTTFGPFSSILRPYMLDSAEESDK